MIAMHQDPLISVPTPRIIRPRRRYAIGQRIGQLPVALMHRNTGPVRLWNGFATPPIRAWQSDFGQVLGGTLKLTGTSPAVTITGNASKPVAIRVVIEDATHFRYSADGGATFIETGKVIPAGSTYAAIGALSGVTFNFAAGVYVATDFYRSTLNAWTDQITGTATLVQASAPSQPVCQIGLNGHVSYLGDQAGTVKMTDTSVDFVAPATTPTFYLAGINQRAWTAGRVLMGAGNVGTAMAVFQTVASPQVVEFAGASVNANSGGAINSWVRMEALFANSVGTHDYTKLGATVVNTGTAGNTDPPVNFNLFADAPASGYCSVEVMFVFVFSSIPTPTELSNFSTLLTSFYGGSMGV